MAKIRAFAIRGLLGQIYSRGMNTIAQRVNQIPEVSCTIQEHGVFYCENARALAEAMALSNRERVLIGHSNGADAALMACHFLKAMGKRVRLLVAVDPTPMVMPVPDNVDQALGYFERLPFQLGGGAIKDDPSDPRVVPIILKQERVTHIQIDDLSEIHAEVEKRFRAIVAGN